MEIDFTINTIGDISDSSAPPATINYAELEAVVENNASPVVPEPISMIFFGTGLVAVGGYVARVRKLRAA